MKKQLSLFLYFLGSSLSLVVYSQHTKDDPLRIRADFYNNNVVFIRTLQEHNPKGTSYAVKNEGDLDNSAYFFRINPNPLFVGEGFDIIEIFKSERYFQKTFEYIYNENNGVTYQNDRDGFHYFAKLIYGDSSLVRLEIYPELITNVCVKKMHFNSCSCNKWVRKKKRKDIDSYELHKKTMVNLLKQLDNETVQTEPDSVYNYNIEQLTRKREVKFQTEIKSFKVDSKNNEVQRLVKEFTKYSLSDDEVLNNSYTLEKLIIPNNIGSKFSKLVFQKGTTGTAEDIPLGELPIAISETNSIITKKKSSVVIAESEVILTANVKCVESTSKNGWIYAGKVTKNTQDIKNLEEAFVKNKAYIKQNNTKCWSPLTDLNVRENAPQKINNNWQKGDEKGVLKEGVLFNINSYELIPGADGFPLLWLAVSYE